MGRSDLDALIAHYRLDKSVMIPPKKQVATGDSPRRPESSETEKNEGTKKPLEKRPRVEKTNNNN